MGVGESLRKGLESLDLKVDEGCQGALIIYLEELLRWGRHINLTAIRDSEAAVEKHLLDALTLMPLLAGD